MRDEIFGNWKTVATPVTLFLHVGTHKTGTTAIQRFALRHKESLRQRGLWYPLYQDFNLNAHYAHHPLAHALARGDAEQAESARTFARAVGEGKVGNVLISAEPMYRHLLGAEPADYWTRRRAYIERLRSHFPTADVEVLLVVRSQDTFAKSLYQERVKVTRYTKTFREFIATEQEYFLYHRQLDAFLEFFPRARVLLFEDLSAVNLIDAFFAALGVDVTDLEHEPSRNIGWPVPLVEFKRVLNGSPLTNEEVRNAMSTFEAAGPGRWTKSDWWTDADARAFMAAFEADNAALAERYFPGRPQPLFPEPTQSAPVFGGLTAKEIGEMTALLVQAKWARAEPSRKGLLRRARDFVLRR